MGSTTPVNDNHLSAKLVRATMTRVRFGIPVELEDYHEAAFSLYIMAAHTKRGCRYDVLRCSPEQALENLKLLNEIEHGASFFQEAPAAPN